MDIVAFADQYPNRGDTVFGKELLFSPGGKGANQAAACAKLGKEAVMIGCVGGDPFGDRVLDALKLSGVDVHAVRRSASASTGTVLVTLDGSAENTMLVVKGANEELSDGDIDACGDVLRSSEALLVQMEVPATAVVRAMVIARECGIPVILDPAPVQGIVPEMLRYADIVVPNRQETAHITGISVTDVPSALAAARWMEEKAGVSRSVIKMAENGSLVYAHGEWEHVAAVPVQPVDTVAAGDCFAGALACALADGQSLPGAARFAAIVSALKVTRRGAQSGIPTLAEVRQFCAMRGLRHEYVEIKGGRG
ncbi:ribokinase [Paenibacillus thalictri]|uniref:Deoxyribokinase n=2 Tax=Paenibacillus thalictri TaxID=2527873 RepID=A0A4Q9DVJ1_9BACL|nr:ribokinase [Paenibacillus thalictri]